MPSSDVNSYTSSRVQRATRLNDVEHSRLQQRLHLLDKARLRQTKLTNQDIRLTSAALDYVLNTSGHSPEGRDPALPPGEEGEEGVDRHEQPQFFLYGERVVSHRVHRMPRPLSSMAPPPPGEGPPASADLSRAAASDVDLNPQPNRSPAHQRPRSSPSKRGRTWFRLDSEELEHRWSHSKPPTKECDKLQNRGRSSSDASSSLAFFNRGMVILAGKERLTPHQAWEDDVHEVTRKLLRAQRLHQQQQQADGSRWSRLHSNNSDHRRRSRSSTPLSYVSFPSPQSSLAPLLPFKDSVKATSVLSSKKHSRSGGSGKASVRTV